MSPRKLLLVQHIGLVAVMLPIALACIEERTASTVDRYQRCDLDFNGVCNKYDRYLGERAINRCVNDSSVFSLSGYIEPADADHDGCVREDDLKEIFAEMPTEE